MPLGRRAFLAWLTAPLVACGPSRVMVSARPPRLEPTTPRAELAPAGRAEPTPERTAGRAEPPPDRAVAVPARRTASALRRTEAPPTPLAEDGTLQRRLDGFMRQQRGQFGVVVRDLHGPVAADY